MWTSTRFLCLIFKTHKKYYVKSIEKLCKTLYNASVTERSGVTRTNPLLKNLS